MHAKNEMRKLTIPTYIYLFLNVKVYEIETASLCKIFGYKKLIIFFKPTKVNKSLFNVGMHLTLR